MLTTCVGFVLKSLCGKQDRYMLFLLVIDIDSLGDMWVDEKERHLSSAYTILEQSCNKVHDLDLQTEYELEIQRDRSKALDKEHLESLEQFIRNRDNLSKGWRMRTREMFVKDDKAKDAVSWELCDCIQWIHCKSCRGNKY